MKLKFYLLKRIVILFKLLLLWMTMDGQIYTWGDFNSTYCNYSVTSIIEGKANDLIIVGKVTDRNYKNLKIGFCRISADGQILTDKISAEKVHLYDLNSILYQPDGFLRVYGTSILKNGMMALYMSLINPRNNTFANNVSIASEPEHFGEAKPINKSKIILIKAIKQSSTSIFNIHAYLINMTSNNYEEKNISIESEFNEESKSLYVLPDTSFFVLGRRDVDQNRSKSFGMIYYISPDFKIKWNMQVLNSAGLTNQNLTCGKDGWIYYISSMKDDNHITCSSKGFIFEKDGNKIRQIEIDSFYVNAILTLKNGNILAAGYKIQKYGAKSIEKAHYIIYDRTLKKIKSRTLGPTDKPDVDLTSIQITTLPGSSEYITAIQLASGKIVLGGSASIPVNIAPDKMIRSTMLNKYLLTKLTPDGDM